MTRKIKRGEDGLAEKDLTEKNLAEKNLPEKDLTEKNLVEKNLLKMDLTEKNSVEKNLPENIWPEKLLDWYYVSGRTHLPWRTNRTAYGTWISEIMLQQTQVVTVIPYFERFMEKYPSVQALADADEQELLKMWQGLGYYSRARNLKKGATQILAEFDRVMPENIDALKKIAGIGPYTAGAISSMAYNQKVPAIDGNALRVYTRLYADASDISLPKTVKKITAAMQDVMPIQAPGDFNQAIMDLGATICTPKVPQCEICPLQTFCQSFAAGTMLDFPVKTKKTKVTPHFFVAMAITDKEGNFILEQRDEKGLLANLWHFPMVEVSAAEFEQLKVEYGDEQSEKPEEFLVAETEAEALASPPNFAKVVWQKKLRGQVQHLYSHQRWQVLLLFGRAKKDFTPKNNQVWAQLTDTALPLPTVQLKLQDLLKK